MKEESIKSIVTDASFVLAILLPDEDEGQISEIVEKYRNGTVTFQAPLLLQFEVINGIKSAIKRKRIDLGLAYTLIKDFLNLSIKYGDIDLKDAVDLAVEKDLSIYDASYVVLAKRLNIPLLSLDKRLEQLAR